MSLKPPTSRRGARRRAARRRPPPPSRTPPRQAAAAAETIRVDVDVIDRLMDLAGELVLTRNQILQINSRSEDSAFGAASQRLNVITAELQDGIMKMRMMPIDNVFSKFPRIVRDLSRAVQQAGAGRDRRQEHRARQDADRSRSKIR